MKPSGFPYLLTRFYSENKRILPWRENINPYHVFLSEIMLQQTQVSRVLKKFPEFIHVFPSFQLLADASFSEVLQLWQGMGYNRRAKYLQESAQIICRQFGGMVPLDPLKLVTLPGIGKATAASIITFTYNIPLVFIETNIRRVFIHHFFSKKKGIEDSDITPLVAKFLDRGNPREWYYAVMDYGSFLAKIIENPNRKSKLYKIQSKFEGSNRQIRGAILRELLSHRSSRETLLEKLRVDKGRFDKVVTELIDEKFLTELGNILKIR